MFWLTLLAFFAKIHARTLIRKSDSAALTLPWMLSNRALIYDAALANGEFSRLISSTQAESIKLNAAV